LANSTYIWRVNANFMKFLVQVYMPAYELYLEGLRKGYFGEHGILEGRKGQLQLVMDVERNVVKSRLF